MTEGDPRGLLTPHVQETLMAEAVVSASVGFLVWNDDRQYIAANECACRLLGGTLDQIVGSVVGSQTVDGDEAVRSVVRGKGGRGRVTVERFDGTGPMTLEYVSFPVRTAALPSMASLIWLAADDGTAPA
jgi:PAS domain-containing protein